MPYENKKVKCPNCEGNLYPTPDCPICKGSGLSPLYCTVQLNPIEVINLRDDITDWVCICGKEKESEFDKYCRDCTQARDIDSRFRNREEKKQ